MAEVKTQPTEQSVANFIAAVPEAARRQDCLTLIDLMTRVTGQPPKMWGPSIVGFGSYHYRYESGREGDWFLTGFSPRKRELTLYIMAGFDRYDALMEQLGKYKTGKSCLYIRTLSDVDFSVLSELVSASVGHMKASYQAAPSPGGS